MGPEEYTVHLRCQRQRGASLVQDCSKPKLLCTLNFLNGLKDRLNQLKIAKLVIKQNQTDVYLLQSAYLQILESGREH